MDMPFLRRNRLRMKPKLNSRQLYALKAHAVYTLREVATYPFSLAEVAAVLGTTKERVRQLEARGRKNFQR